MKRTLITFVIVTAVVAVTALTVNAKIASTTAAQQQVLKEKQLARGAYLVTIGGCNDCHTPLKMGPKGPEPDRDRMLSGHPQSLVMTPPPKQAPNGPWMWSGAVTNTAFAGPWGISYARNLTPDKI